jgi:beta-lactamase regulating signal transducer with metallopeptidase domain
MTALISLIDHPAAGVLAAALVHFLWQGALLTLAFAAWLRFAKPAAAAMRYLGGVLTLAAMLVAPAATFVYLSSRPPVSAPASTASAAVADPAGAGSAADAARQQAPLRTLTSGDFAAGPSRTLFGAPLPVVVLALWIAGVITLSLRLLGGWMLARRLSRRAIRPVAPEIHALARRVAGRLALDRLVHILESSAVRVPVMVGWLKPVVLLPASALSGLTPTQIEALLAHELAHIRRHDYLVNLLQSAVETLLFYHPGVWWVSRQIRTEREHCADDLAVAVCDRLVYVSALADLAQMTAAPRLALAATDGSLVRRVRRLLAGSSDHHPNGSSWLPVLIVVLFGGAVVPAVVTSRDTLEATGSGSQVTAQSQGVPAGVVGGLPGGVSEGVMGGLPGGVIGGLPGGVIGGVPGGVPSGVVGGVPGGIVALPTNQQTADVQSEARQREQAREVAEKIRQQLVEIEKALAEMNDQRALVDQKLVAQKVEAEIAALRSQIAATEDTQLRARQLYEQGLLSQSNVRELETQLQALRQRLLQTKAEQEFRTAEAQLKGRDQDLLRDYEKTRSEYEKALAELAGRSLEKKRVEELELRAYFDDLKARQELASADDVRARKEIEELFKRQLGSDVPADALLRKSQDRTFRDLMVLSETIELTAPNETIRAGDVLTIDIQGEPDLPRVYVVEPDGTVRLPLVGAVRVVSLTARHARDAVQKQLTDRRIESRDVTVGLRRPKGKASPAPSVERRQEPYVERQ